MTVNLLIDNVANVWSSVFRNLQIPVSSSRSCINQSLTLICRIVIWCCYTALSHLACSSWWGLTFVGFVGLHTSSSATVCNNQCFDPCVLYLSTGELKQTKWLFCFKTLKFLSVWHYVWCLSSTVLLKLFLVFVSVCFGRRQKGAV